MTHIHEPNILEAGTGAESQELSKKTKKKRKNLNTQLVSSAVHKGAD